MKRLILSLLLAAPAFSQIAAWSSASGNNSATLSGCATHHAYFVVANVSNTNYSGALLGTTIISSTSISSGNWTAGTERRDTSGGGADTQLFYAYSASIGDSETIGVSGGNNPDISAQCYSGVQSTSPLDKEVEGDGGWGTSMQLSVSPGRNGELLVFGCSAQSVNTTLSIASGFTIATSSSTTGEPGCLAYLIQTTAATASPTLSGWNFPSGSLMSFKAAAVSISIGFGIVM